MTGLLSTEFITGLLFREPLVRLPGLREQEREIGRGTHEYATFRWREKC